MYKDLQNEPTGGTPHSPWAAASHENLQRPSNREHRWKPRQKPSEHCLDRPWFCSHKGHEQLCLTQPLHQTHTHAHHQMAHHQGLGTSPITPEPLPFPSSGVCQQQRSLHRTLVSGGLDLRLFNLPSTPVPFPVRGTALLLEDLMYCQEHVYLSSWKDQTFHLRSTQDSVCGKPLLIKAPPEDTKTVLLREQYIMFSSKIPEEEGEGRLPARQGPPGTGAGPWLLLISYPKHTFSWKVTRVAARTTPQAGQCSLA